VLRLKVVLDTNVVVSAHLNAEGLERFVLDLALTQKVKCYVSPEILAEYDGVLHRPKFALDPELVKYSLGLIRGCSETIQVKRRVSVTRNPADNKFLECAQVAGADYLVTGNKRHFPNTWENTQVVNAKEFIQVIAPDLKR